MIVDQGFVPPQPLCPAPAVAVNPPSLLVAVGGGEARPADMGSSSVMTCSTVGNNDAQLPEPAMSLAAGSDDVLVFSVEAGWRILEWEGTVGPKAGDATGRFPSTATPDQPTSFRVPIQLPGDSLVAVTVWCLRADGRAVAQVSAVVWVRVP